MTCTCMYTYMSYGVYVTQQYTGWRDCVIAGKCGIVLGWRTAPRCHGGSFGWRACGIATWIQGNVHAPPVHVHVHES